MKFCEYTGMALPTHIQLLVACASICATLILARCIYRVLFRCKRHSHYHCYRRWQLDDTYMAMALLPVISRTILMSWAFSLNPQMVHNSVSSKEAAEAGTTIEKIDSNRELAFKLMFAVYFSYAL